MRSRIFLWAPGLVLVTLAAAGAQTVAPGFDGLDMNLGNLSRLSDAQIAIDQPGEFRRRKRAKAAWRPRAPARAPRGSWAGRWKVSPSVRIKAQSTFTVAEIDGPGAIQQIWMTPSPLDKTRQFILRFYWDGETEPSVEVPMGDFFACGWGKYLPDQFAAGVRQSGQRLQLLLVDAVPQEGEDHPGEPRRPETWCSITRSTTR